MELVTIRQWFKEEYTIGKLLVDGQYFCDTLEDRYRAIPEVQKIYGKTAIPFGRYRVIMSPSKRFGRVMPELLNVPYFTAIRIHSGNTDADTAGCILVGKNTIKGVLTDSRKWSDLLNERLLVAQDNIYMDIRD